MAKFAPTDTVALIHQGRAERDERLLAVYERLPEVVEQEPEDDGHPRSLDNRDL